MRASKEKKIKNRLQGEERFALSFSVVPIIGFLIFNGLPLIIAVIALFCNVDLYDFGNITWNNFEGFKCVFIPGHAYDLFQVHVAEFFYKAVGITIWVGSTQLVTLAIALVMGALLRENLKGSGVFQVLYFIPYICSTVAVALMWRWIFAYDGGIVNTLFGTDMKWLEDTRTMTWVIILAIIWQAPGYGIVMYRAAFSNINASLYEAAKMDGANGWQQFWHITFPGVLPTTFFLLQAGVGAGLLTYTIAAMIIPDWWGQIGGADQMGLTLMRLVKYLIGETATDASGVSYVVSCASVISMLLFIVIGSLSYILMKLREKSTE